MSYIPKVGDRVEMLSMANDPDPIPSGSVGTVTYVSEMQFGPRPYQTQVGVAWDSGRTLSCLVPPDVLARAKS